MEKRKTCNFDTTSKSNSETGVLVLPPEIASKLGISLNNFPYSRVQSSATSPVKDSDQNIGHSSSPNYLPECRDISSIIETANLMKESVFLSPTFLQTASNAIHEEEESIIMVDKESVNMDDTISLKSGNVPYSSNTNAEKNAMCEEVTSGLIHKNVIIHSNHGISVKQVDDLGVFESIKEYQVENQDGNLILTDIPNAQISNAISKPISQVDEHSDEAYLSDCSNSYSRCSPESFASVVNKQNSLNKKKESHEKVATDPAQLEDLQESDAIFVPITMSSIAIGQEVYTNSNITVPGKRSEMISIEQSMIKQPVMGSNNTNEENIQQSTSETSSNNLISWTLADQKENEIKITKIDYNPHNKSIIYISDSINTENQSKNTNMVPVDSECAQNSEKKYYEKSAERNNELLSIVEKDNNNTQSSDDTILKKPLRRNIISCITENNSSKEDKEEANIISATKDDSLDKVKEIAAYLSQIANERKNIIKNKNSYKEKETQVVPIQSKLLFLGVEKPDVKLIQKDEIKCTKVLRTYRRPFIRKQIPNLITNSCKIKIADLFQLSIIHDIEMHDTTIALKSQNEFCICNDFGNLAYYDCEMLYENIHFWSHANIDCDLEILFSIYNDEYTVSNQSIDIVQDEYQSEHNEGDIIRNNLCWNELNVKRKNDEKFGSDINDNKESEEADSSSEQKSSMKAVRRRTSKIVESKADKDVVNIAKKSRKSSSIATNEFREHMAKKKTKSGVCNQFMSQKEWGPHKETGHDLNACRADKQMQINYPSTPGSSLLIKPTGRSSSKFINSKVDITSFPAQKYSSEIIDSSITASTRGYINIDKNPSPKLTRRTSKTRIELRSNLTRFSENSNIEVLSQTFNNEIGVPSLSDINSSKFEKDIAVSPTKEKSKTSLSPTLSGQSTDVVANKMDLSTSTRSRFKLKNIKSDVEFPLSYTEKAKNIDAKCVSMLPKKPSLNTPSNILPASSSRRNKALSLKTTMPSKSDTSVSAKVADTDRKCSENIMTKIDTPVATRKISVENDSADILLIKPTKNNELMKQAKAKEIVVPTKLSTENTDSQKVDKAIINTNISTRSTRRSSVIIDIESPCNNTKGLHIIDTGINNKSPRSTKRSSNIKSVFSDLSTKSTTNDDLTKSENEKKSITPTSKGIVHTDSAKVVKNIDTNTSTKHIKKSSGIENETANKSTKVSNATNIEIRSPKESTIVKDSCRPQKLTTPVSTENIIKPSESATSSRSSRKSTNIEICESPKSSKISTNTVTVHTPIKMLKTMEITDSEMDNLPNVSALKNTEIKKINELKKHTEMSSGIEVFDEKVLKNQSNNDTSATIKSTKIEVTSAIENKQSESTEREGPNSNKNNAKISNPKEIEVTLKCTEPVSQSTDISIVNSTISKELSSYITSNDSQTTDENHKVVIEIESPSDIADKMTKCGVCAKSVKDLLWIEHISKEHDYLAWRDSEPALNLEDEAAVKSYLQVIAKENDGLKCSKCGLVRKFAKLFMRHMKNCSGNEEDETDVSTANVDANLNSSQEQDDDSPLSTMKSRKPRVQRKSRIAPTVTCGVCSKTVVDSEWIEHIRVEHKYLAWRAEENPVNLDDEDAVKSHLNIISKYYGGLLCSKCGSKWNYVKKYLLHESLCDETDVSTANVDANLNSSQEQNDDSPLPTKKSRKSRVQRKSTIAPTVTCGVCSKTVEGSEWIEHIRVEHKYLAWRAEENPVSLDDEDEVKSHLNIISKYYGGLLCSKCGSKWNYVKKYLLHESLCDGSLIKKELNTRKDKKTDVVFPPVVTCGICKLDVEGKNWLKHIQLAHQYLAWMDGEKPLDVDNYDEVKAHLTKVINMTGELICMKCGTSRVFARAYLLHVNACTNSGFEMQITEPTNTDKGKYECGVCHEKGTLKKWKAHAMKKHYNVAWMVGELPINVRNFYAVEKYLKEYQKKYSLICNHCKSSRTSCYGFYAHILTCGKTEEEIEAVHNLCEICNNKYLCVYRNQHIASHRDSMHRREMRELKSQIAAEEVVTPQEQHDDQLTGKRRAAEKAKKVIKKYSSNVVDGKPVCFCGATFENAEELSQHNCTQKRKNEDDESDVSVKTEPESEMESDDETEIDSTVSDSDEEEQKKKKRHRIGEGSTKISRMPYRVNNYNAYLVQGFRDFCNLHYTSDSLFNEWRGSEYQVVPADEMHKYLPSLTESCKVRFGGSDDGEWITYKRFESKKIKGYSIFTGGTVQCMSWAPPNIADETLGNFLAVYSHRGPDVPRHGIDERPEHPALVQIWDFKQFNFLPKCVLTLALDYGIVWSMDWCPSGGRDRDREPCARGGDSGARDRLGLLAVACSNGTAYILAVPCPPAATEDEPVMYKLKPVAELRLSMTSERRVYQATCIKWSQQKGHETIIVGYSDGTTAMYDVNSESPFLKTTENGVTIFYPYQDKQSENSAVTGVGVCASVNEGYSSGAYFSASLTGGTLCAWPRTAPSARVHAPAAQAYHSPHWPSVTLAGDAPFMKTVTELEWWGSGRRAGASRAGGACARCGRAAAAAAPAVRLVRAHPCYPDIKKLIIATLLMVPIGQKRKRKANDDFSMVVEPLTYEDAVGKYGLQFDLVPKNDQAAAQKLCNDNELCPERFPLSDIVAVAFCPSSRYHDKLAVATHTGIIFVINA